LVTFKKSNVIKKSLNYSNEETVILFSREIEQWLKNELLDTNEIFMRIMKMVLYEKILIGNVDLLKILVQQFILTKDKKWTFNDKLKFY
jgi:hypothetical protein